MSKCDLSQSSDQNMDESIFTTTGIYIIVRASYVNLNSLFAQLARANVCRFLTTRHTQPPHNSLVKKKQLHSYNPLKDKELRNDERSKSSSEVHKFNSASLTFLACAKYEIPKFGTIPQITQIVHNDILCERNEISPRLFEV